MDRSGHHVEQVLDAEYWDVPLTVLVNGYSASASELFAAAVQDYDRGKVIGTRTFGKGIVQTLILFDDDQTGLQMTTDQYFSPLGRSLHGVGVEPDMVVEPSENYVLDEDLPDPARDSQLRAAIELLREPASVQLHHS
jgi:carboxyl-terminal processing protease